MSNDGEQTKEHERCHSLKENLTLSKAYLIDSGASNHMVASRDSFTTFTLSGRPRTHMGYEPQIQIVERGSIKIHHDEFIPSPTTKQIVEDEEEAKSSTQLIRIGESLLGVTPSPAALKFYEIYDISSSHMNDP